MKKLRALFTCAVVLAILLNAAGLDALAATLTLPDSLEIIEEEAFSGDTSIDEVVLPDGVEEIRSKAFADSSVSSVNLPDSLTYIADDAFDGPEQVTVTADKGTYAYDWAKENGYIGEAPDLSDVVLEDTNADKTLRQDAPAVYNIKSDDIVIGVNNTLTRAAEDAGKIRVTAWHTNVEPVLGSADPSKKKGNYICDKDLTTSQLLQYMINDQAILTIPTADLSKTTYIVIRVGGYTTSRASEPAVWADFAIKINQIVIPDNADDFEYGDWDAAYCVITGYNGIDTVVVIPDTAPDGRTVRGIDSCAFEANTTIQSVTIPSTVIQICDGAFKECTKLTSVTFEDGLEEINYQAFAECPLLTTISLPDSVTSISAGAFEGCARLAHVDLSPNWEYVGGSTFSPFTNCPKLTSIVIPEGMNVIPADAFRSMESLKTVTLHDGVYKIEPYAFYNCTALTGIDLPDALEEIGGYAFADCVKLTSIAVPESVDVLNGYTFSGCTRLNSVTLPDTMRRVEDYAFGWCTALTSIHLPDSIEAMGMDVFYGCERLTTVNYPAGLLKAHWSFEGCERLTTITVADGVTELPETVFAGMESLKTVSLPDTLVGIGASAFLGCSALTAISIPDGVDTIGSQAFDGCASLRSVSLPEKVDVIKWYTFSRCTLLSNVYIPETVDKIEDGAFYDCDALTSISLPAGLLEMGNSVFAECGKLASITIPEGIYELPDNTFQNDVKLSSVSLPANMDAIGSNAFNGCTALRSIQLPESLEKIHYDAFSGTALTSVTVPSRVEYIGSSAFAGCERLSSVSLPDGLQELGGEAFANDTALKSIALPDSIRKLGSGVFSGCSMLSTVNYPASLEEITYSDYSPYAFECERLRSISVPDGVTVIPENAFSRMNYVRTVTLPDSVLEIKDYAFAQTYDLTAVYIGEKVDTIADNAFWDCSEDLVIYGVAGSYAETYAGEKGIRFVDGAIPSSTVKISGSIVTDDYTGFQSVIVKVYADSTLTKLASQSTTNTDGSWSWNAAVTGMQYWLHLEKAGWTFSDNDFMVAVGSEDVTAPTIIATEGNNALASILLSDYMWTTDADAHMKLVNVDVDGSWYVSSAPDWASIYVDSDMSRNSKGLEINQESVLVELGQARHAKAVSEIQYTTSDQMIVMLAENGSGTSREGTIVLSNGMATGVLNIEQTANVQYPGVLNSVLIDTPKPYYVGQTIDLSIVATQFIDGIILVENTEIPNGREIYHFTDSDYNFKYQLQYTGDYSFTVGLSTTDEIDLDESGLLYCSDYLSIELYSQEYDANWGGMIPSDSLLSFLQSYEGFAETHYISSSTGNYVIGYGHEYTNLGDFAEPISKDKARNIMLYDLQKYARAVNAFADKYGIAFTQSQFDAMVDYAYNSGPAGFQGTSKYEYNFIKMLKNSGGDPSNVDSTSFCRSLISVNGAGTAGEKLGIFRRRMDEADMFFNGDYIREYPTAPSWLDTKYSNKGSEPSSDWIPSFLGQGYLSIENKDVMLPCSKNTAILIDIVADGDWHATHTGTWITLDIDSGSGDGTIQFSTTENNGSSVRNATIKVTCGNRTVNISVRQKGTQVEGLRLSFDFEPATMEAGKPLQAITTVTGGAGAYSLSYTISAVNAGSDFSPLRGIISDALTETLTLKLSPLPAGEYVFAATVTDSAGDAITQRTHLTIRMRDMEIIQPASGTVVDHKYPFKVEWGLVENAEEYVLRIRDLTTQRLVIGDEQGDGLHLLNYVTNYLFINSNSLRGHDLRIWVGAYANRIRIAQSQVVITVGIQDEITVTLDGNEDDTETTATRDYVNDDVAFYQMSIREFTTDADTLLVNHATIKTNISSHVFSTSIGNSYRFWIGAYTKDGALIAQGQEMANYIEAENGFGASTYEDAVAMKSDSDTIQVGKIRYIHQNPVEKWWKDGAYNFAYDYKYQAKQFYDEDKNYCKNMCTRAVFSMALSYLGIDETPAHMSTLMGEGQLLQPYDNTGNGVYNRFKTDGTTYNTDVCTAVGVKCRSSNNISELTEYYRDYNNNLNYSPVYFYMKHVNSKVKHAILVIGWDGANEYYALDPGRSRTPVIKFTLDNGVIKNCSQSDYNGRPFVSCHQYYK